ncbi:MAG: FMN-binding protein [SAR324 cluster bacterium]|jgi:electron transport complex protein RnfG|nr:FMN-binding protein [SAR324 cluster bacterium]MDP6247745.1 FMN-binding protein [SAR324 cluster bacterium]MDP7137366.1 FMN-binding protein [SAR324 cluster bacterium]MDP7333325.1 FMN-binding protein [SAR324 cluster bacterium]MDP7502259.1 FMN-binding protein [SAR324 cluster bacterium]|tara:strand:+ start:16121 stop:16801 length:681 start_codon:yes stop_codon:yes gene_type:complete
MEPEIQAEGVAALQPVEETSSLRMILTLGLAGMISGLALVGIYLFTAPIIEANKAEALRRAIFLVVPGSESYQTLELQDSGLVAIDPEQKKGNKGGERIYAAFDGAGDLLGFAIPGAEPGFQDLIQGIFGYRADERMIIGFEVLDSKETPGLGDKIIKDQHFRTSLTTLKVDPEIVAVKPGDKHEANQVETITGATISSKTVIRLLEKTVRRWIPLIENYLSTGAA